jgi:hypothetical protein
MPRFPAPGGLDFPQIAQARPPVQVRRLMVNYRVASSSSGNPAEGK